MTPRVCFTVPLPGREPLQLGERTLLMGILNVTPDSFADGGRHFDPAQAITEGLRMAADGADIIDIGGESTRPGAEPLDAGEELRRVLPVIRALGAQVAVPLSIDTYKAPVAAAAIEAGASIVNDISGLQYDPDLGRVVARTGAAVVLMHTRGRSRGMYELALYDDVISEITAELEQAGERARAAGIPAESVIFDPGIGFAKKPLHSISVVAHLDAFARLGRPVLSGPSRKSFLKSAVGERAPDDREWATAAAVTACVLLGAHIVRVHGVRDMRDVVLTADRIRDARMESWQSGCTDPS
jgi:dihydropteroate synthase